MPSINLSSLPFEFVNFVFQIDQLKGIHLLVFFSLQQKKAGGLSFNSTVPLTKCNEKLVQMILHEYSILFINILHAYL